MWLAESARSVVNTAVENPNRSRKPAYKGVARFAHSSIDQNAPVTIVRERDVALSPAQPPIRMPAGFPGRRSIPFSQAWPAP